jgi:hypothetical protein
MRSRYLVATAIAASATLAACDADYDQISSPAPKERFAATLTPGAVVPAATATSSGSVTFTLMDSATVRYEVLVSGMTGPTLAHIHAGTATENGPIIATLFTGAAPAGVLSGVLRQGDLTPATALSNNFTFAQLVQRIRAGTAYVDVHTTARTAGELRGQIGAAQ